MNYAHYASWIRERVEDLVEFGVPRGEAEAVMHYVEIAGINAEAKVRADRQFLLQLKQVGTKEMARMLGKTESAVRKRKAKMVNAQPKTIPPVAV